MNTISTTPLTAQLPDKQAPRRAIGPALAAIVGIVAVAATLAVAELLARLASWAGLVTTSASPFDSLGAGFIAITPEWLKDFGIGLFGQNDKVALAVVMTFTFALFGCIVGWVSRARYGAGVVTALVLLAIAGLAIVTRPGGGIPELLPLLAGGATGIMVLHSVFRLRYGEAPGWGGDVAVADAALRSDGHARPDGHDRPEAHDETVAADPVIDTRRRRALRIAGVSAVGALASGALSRLIPSPVDIQADRAAVALPPVDPGTPPPSAATASPPTSSSATAITPPAAARPPAVIPPAQPYGADPDVSDLTPFATSTDAFYRVDTAFVPPRVGTATWSLKVHGLVRHPFELTWDELLQEPQIARWVTLACVSNEVGGSLVGNAAWQGVRVGDLLARAQPQDGADCVLSTSADGFTATTPLDTLTDGRDALVAIGMNGSPLPVEHGFPARLVVPGLYGYVSATKWVVDLEVTRFADATAYWTERGWAPRGPIKTSSRIDTPHYGVTVKPGVVAVAGVAWAQHRGISGVQVRVDDGPWQDAILSPAASADTWVQWVYRWDTSAVDPGSHVLTCRAIDGTGAVQDGTARPVVPDGATGYHSVPIVTG